MLNFHLFFSVILMNSFFPFNFYSFKFSVITAIYNTGKYLNESIDSLLGQSYGFDKIQLLDYKFFKTRVVNLLKEYRNIQLSSSSCFFRSKIIKNTKFNEEIKYSEDILFINTILLNKPKIGFIRDALYNYRSRKDRSSAIQNCNKDNSFYFDTLIKVHYFLIQLSISLYNKIVSFIKYFLLYDITFRIKTNAKLFLDNVNYIKYRKMIVKAFDFIKEKRKRFKK